MKGLYAFLDWFSVILSFAMFLLLYAMIIFSVFQDGKLLIHTNDYHEMILEVILFGAFMILAIWRAPSICRKMSKDMSETYLSADQESEELEVVKYSESIFSFLAD